MIEEIVKKIKTAEKRMSDEKGGFSFFGLSKRNDLDEWDIIVSASWFSGNKQSDLVYIIGNIKRNLNNEDLRFLARVVLLSPTELIVQKLNSEFDVGHGSVEGREIQINNINLKHIYVITSNNMEDKFKSGEISVAKAILERIKKGRKIDDIKIFCQAIIGFKNNK